MGQNLGPAQDGVSGKDGRDDGTEGVADIRIRVSDVTQGEGFDIVKDIIPDIAGVILDVGLEQKSGDCTRCGELLGHLGQDIDEVVVVVGHISERLELLSINKPLRKKRTKTNG